MDIKQWFKDYLAKNAPCQSGGEDGTLRAAVDMYKVTGEDDFREFVLEHATCPDAHADQELFFLWEQTGEENDRQAIEQRMQQIREAGAPADGKAIYTAGPFWMAYEMKCGGMEKVAQVVQMFRNVHDNGMQPDCWQLLALADAIAWCREELYEHYRALIDMFRAELAAVLQNKADEEAALLSCALLKAVRLGIINPEKYLPVGKRLFESMQQPSEDDVKAIGPYMMAYSEYLQAE